MRKMPNKGRTEKNMKRIISVLLCALMIVAVMVIPATATTSYTFPKAAETFNLTDGKDPNGVSYTIANGKATVGVNTYSDSCSFRIHRKRRGHHSRVRQGLEGYLPRNRCRQKCFQRFRSYLRCYRKQC